MGRADHHEQRQIRAKLLYHIHNQQAVVRIRVCCGRPKFKCASERDCALQHLESRTLTGEIIVSCLYVVFQTTLLMFLQFNTIHTIFFLANSYWYLESIPRSWIIPSFFCLMDSTLRRSSSNFWRTFLPSSR